MKLTGTPPDGDWVLKCAEILYYHNRNKVSSGVNREELYKVVRGEEDAPKRKPFSYLEDYAYIIEETSNQDVEPAVLD